MSEEAIESILLGGGRQYTRAQVAELAGVPVDRASDLWRALGFATQDDDAAVFTNGDVQALRLTNQLIQNGILDPAIAASTARMIGQHMSRLAESQVHLLRDVLAANPELGADERQLARLVEHLTPELEALQNYVWRRHLAAYAGRMLAAPDEEIDERRQAVGFADMVGFTSLTRHATEPELVKIVEGFESLAAEVVAENHGQIIKMLGDEVLFVANSPTAGAEIALTLLTRADQKEDVPPLRAGLAYGRVLNRFGDIYGPVVNIASRLTSAARPGTVLVDLEMSEALKQEKEYTTRPRRPVSVRGYTRLHSAALRRKENNKENKNNNKNPPPTKPDLSTFTAELLGLKNKEEETPTSTQPPHIPLKPDNEQTTPKRLGRRHKR